MYVSRSTKNFIVFLIAIVVVITLWAVFTNPADDGYTAEKLEWSVGTIDDETGLFVKDTEDAMVSNLIEIKGGFKIVPEYTSGVSYDIYYFDEIGLFVSAGDAGEKMTKALNADEVPETAFYLRIVLHPVDESESINFVEKFIYAKQIEVSTKPLAE